MRRKAKTANFGIIYGISTFGLPSGSTFPAARQSSSSTAISRLSRSVKQYMEQSIEVAREKGYVETLNGRKRMLPDIHSHNSVVRGYAERNAINAPIQGSAADIIKIAMVRIFDRFEREGLQAKMILQVHDELNFTVPLSEIDTVSRIVKEEMEPGGHPACTARRRHRYRQQLARSALTAPFRQQSAGFPPPRF